MFIDAAQIHIRIAEVADAEPLAGSLFERSFGAALPDFPKHFVLLAEDDQGQTSTLGYVHFTKHEDIYLGGGMCVDTRQLRQLPRLIRSQLNQQGGVAYVMLSQAVEQLNDCVAVFGYVGHQGAYKIDLAVGFQPTEHAHLIVYWKQPLSAEQQAKTIEVAHQCGPF